MKARSERLAAAEVDECFRRLRARMPGRIAGAKGPKGEADPFRALVACMLSAQSRDANTRLAAEALFRLADTPDGMLTLDEAVIADAIRPCGLYNAKGRNILRMAAALSERHGGMVPTTREGLMALPGVGRKCADIMLSFVYDRPVIAVDTHVFRVANRLGLACATTADRTADELAARSPGWALQDGHFWLIQFGKAVCHARRPSCSTCFLSDLCLWRRSD
ncbi:endonuclease III [Aureimonas altamirensis]|uniref:endonuclease III domain-containing protein n=1 Tax=Aureimonas altamirensis TaxID=370622 RepID=UPI0020371CFD|nr:endonuclease III [Aureimonas altamirensis]MCM2504115.1 endonuclease III [Aureimonas altamirensis]